VETGKLGNWSRDERFGEVLGGGFGRCDGWVEERRGCEGLRGVFS
jgi:hypothetical protein